MTQRTYTIELRIDFADDTLHKIVTQAGREAARGLLATAMMLRDHKDPQIMYETGDMFEKNKDLTIMDEDINDPVLGLLGGE